MKHIHRLVVEDGLVPGDKLPSERELAERLGVGRSSVREALRALEFLGLIETRRGEGTYLCEVGGHQLIELLAMFLLENERAKADLAETKWLIERLLLELACLRCSEDALERLEKPFAKNRLISRRFFRRLLRRLTTTCSSAFGGRCLGLPPPVRPTGRLPTRFMTSC